jgi:hypothetical protein
MEPEHIIVWETEWNFFASCLPCFLAYPPGHSHFFHFWERPKLKTRFARFVGVFEEYIAESRSAPVNEVSGKPVPMEHKAKSEELAVAKEPDMNRLNKSLWKENFMRVVLQTPEDTIVREYSVFAGGWTEQTKPRLEFCELLTGPSKVGRTRPLFVAQALKSNAGAVQMWQRAVPCISGRSTGWLFLFFDWKTDTLALFILFSGVFVAQV